MMTWRKSSRSLDNATCVEVSAPAWRRSSLCDTAACVEVNFHAASSCAGGECVEVAFRTATASTGNGACVEVADCRCGDDVLVRDSKRPDDGVLSIGRAGWAEFIAGVKRGSYDL